VARFTATVEVAAPAARVWQALVDWPAHGRWVPLTRVTVLTPSGAGVGARFVGRTGIGPLAFDDPMQVTEWVPPSGSDPGRCRVVKQGRVVRGAAWFTVVPLGTARCRVAWTEDVEITPARLTRPLRRLVEPAGRRAFTATLRQLAAEVEAAPAGPGGADRTEIETGTGGGTGERDGDQ
jgi:hypothetical protein